MNKLLLYAFMLVISLLVSSVAHAAELRGRFTGIRDATIQVKCADKTFGPAPIGNDGYYAIVGLPMGKSCSFIVSSNDVKSRSIFFSTTRSMTIFNGLLIQQNGYILVIRQ